MTKAKSLIGAAVAAFWALPAAAEMPIYAYGTKANQCPAGLRPVVVGGVICCGTPNQSMTYQQANAHPVRKTVRKKVRRVASTYCPEGMTGCVSQ